MAQSLLSGPTIAGGSSISPSINANPTGAQYTLFAVVMPDGWDDAPLTFQWSFDDTTYYDLFNDDGNEVSYVVIPNSVVLVSHSISAQYLKFRSGPRSNPIPQSDDRVFSILIG